MAEIDNSSTFADNISLPIHRWYRYTAGFSAEWVKNVVKEYLKKTKKESIVVLDPFSGSGTTLLACDEIGIDSIGYESHPLVYEIASAKLSWDADASKVKKYTQQVLAKANEKKYEMAEYPSIITKCYDEKNLEEINALRNVIDETLDDSKEARLIWVGFVSMLRTASHAGTATWQYVLPNKKKAKVLSAYEAFERQMEMICDDILGFQKMVHKKITSIES